MLDDIQVLGGEIMWRGRVALDPCLLVSIGDTLTHRSGNDVVITSISIRDFVSATCTKSNYIYFRCNDRNMGKGAWSFGLCYGCRKYTGGRP